jgi:hypothetical protein
MTRRQRNALERPEWLDKEIYKLGVRWLRSHPPTE